MNVMNLVTKFLENAEIGEYVEYDGKTIEVVDMAGGRFLCLDSRLDVVKLTWKTDKAVDFLMNYKGDEEYDPCG